MDSSYIGSSHYRTNIHLLVSTRKRAYRSWHGNLRTRRPIRNNNSHARRRNKNVARNIIGMLHTSSNSYMDIRRDIQKNEVD